MGEGFVSCTAAHHQGAIGSVVADLNLSCLKGSKHPDPQWLLYHFYSVNERTFMILH